MSNFPVNSLILMLSAYVTPMKSWTDRKQNSYLAQCKDQSVWIIMVSPSPPTGPMLVSTNKLPRLNSIKKVCLSAKLGFRMLNGDDDGREQRRRY